MGNQLNRKWSNRRQKNSPTQTDLPLTSRSLTCTAWRGPKQRTQGCLRRIATAFQRLFSPQNIWPTFKPDSKGQRRDRLTLEAERRRSVTRSPNARREQTPQWLLWKNLNRTQVPKLQELQGKLSSEWARAYHLALDKVLTKKKRKMEQLQPSSSDFHESFRRFKEMT